MTSTLLRPDPTGPSSHHSSPGPVVRLAGASLRHPIVAVIGWLVLVVACVLGGNLAGMNRATDAQLSPGEAGRATALIDAAGLGGPDTESVLITARAGGRPSAGAGAAGQVTSALSSLPTVAKISPPVVSADGSALLLQVTLTEAADDPEALVTAVAAVADRYPQLQLDVTGGSTINADVDAQLGRDFSSALVLSLPITIVILLLAFGALLAAGVPVLLGVSSVLSAVGLYTVASHVLPDGGTAAEMILLIGMAVGVDYSLFYLKREREERRAGRTGRDALLVAAATAGHAVVTSGVAVIVAMAGLFLLGDINFASMAVGAIIVVALAVLGSLTVLPAVLGLLGERVDRPRIPWISRLTLSGRPARIWPALLRPAMRYPVLTLLIATAGMLLLAWPATGLHLKNSTVADLPQDLPSVAGYERLTNAFPDQLSGLEVVLTGSPEAVAPAATTLRDAVQENPGLGTVTGTTSRAGTTVVSIAVPFNADSAEAHHVLDVVRGQTIPSALAGHPGVDVAVGGEIARGVDYLDELSAGVPLVIGFVLLMTFLLMTLAFRSVVVGVVTIVANLLSAGAAFGVLALVFQSQWGADLLGFNPAGGVIAWIPVFLFVILFGLSMDYHVLVVSRIKEAVDRGLSTREAVREGVIGSASVISSAAAVMIGVFGIFAGLHMVEFKQLGIGLSVAVFLDAVVVRILILPALMALLGRANWWAPRWLRRRPTPLTTTGSGASTINA